MLNVYKVFEILKIQRIEQVFMPSITLNPQYIQHKRVQNLLQKIHFKSLSPNNFTFIQKLMQFVISQSSKKKWQFAISCQYPITLCNTHLMFPIAKVFLNCNLENLQYDFLVQFQFHSPKKLTLNLYYFENNETLSFEMKCIMPHKNY